MPDGWFSASQRLVTSFLIAQPNRVSGTVYKFIWGADVHPYFQYYGFGYMGACHGCELGFVLGMYEDGYSYLGYGEVPTPWDDDTIAMGVTMKSFWLNMIFDQSFGTVGSATWSPITLDERHIMIFSPALTDGAVLDACVDFTACRIEGTNDYRSETAYKWQDPMYKYDWAGPYINDLTMCCAGLTGPMQEGMGYHADCPAPDTTANADGSCNGLIWVPGSPDPPAWYDWAGDVSLMGSPIAKSTTNGPIVGRLGDDGIERYFGVPTAADTGGDNRWKPPLPVSWTVPKPTVLETNCMNIDFFGVPKGMEDCVSVDVLTPHGESNLPVFVYIHGGGFVMQDPPTSRLTSGYYQKASGSEERLAIFVFNHYRLGGLGFMAHPALSDESDYGGSGNYGLMDQQWNLQWVQDNIATFGGDPTRVTIVGESAGGASIMMLLASPLSAGLFHTAIAESPYINFKEGVYSMTARYAMSSVWLALTGCGNPGVSSGTFAAAEIACLRDPAISGIYLGGMSGWNGATAFDAVYGDARPSSSCTTRSTAGLSSTVTSSPSPPSTRGRAASATTSSSPSATTLTSTRPSTPRARRARTTARRRICWSTSSRCGRTTRSPSRAASPTSSTRTTRGRPRLLTWMRSTRSTRTSSRCIRRPCSVPPTAGSPRPTAS